MNQKEVMAAPLKNSREIASMLKKLPKEERLRIEGIIIGVSLRNSEAPDDVRNSA